MHLQMHWNGALDASDPVHLLQVSPEGQSPPPKVPKSMSRYPSNGGSMGTLTADSLQGIRGKGAHLGLGSEFIENEPWDPILFPFYDTLSAQTRYGGISTCLQTEGPWAPLPRIPCKESAVRVPTSVWEVSSLKTNHGVNFYGQFFAAFVRARRGFRARNPR